MFYTVNINVTNKSKSLQHVFGSVNVHTTSIFIRRALGLGVSALVLWGEHEHICSGETHMQGEGDGWG